MNILNSKLETFRIYISDPRVSCHLEFDKKKQPFIEAICFGKAKDFKSGEIKDTWKGLPVRAKYLL